MTKRDNLMQELLVEQLQLLAPGFQKTKKNFSDWPFSEKLKNKCLLWNNIKKSVIKPLNTKYTLTLLFVV